MHADIPVRATLAHKPVAGHHRVPDCREMITAIHAASHRKGNGSVRSAGPRLGRDLALVPDALVDEGLLDVVFVRRPNVRVERHTVRFLVPTASV